MCLLFEFFFFRRVEKESNRVSQCEFCVCFGKTRVERDSFLEQLNHSRIVLLALEVGRGARRDDPGVLKVGSRFGLPLGGGCAFPGSPCHHEKPQCSQRKSGCQRGSDFDSCPTLLAAASGPDRSAHLQQGQISLQLACSLVTPSRIRRACFEYYFIEFQQ